MAECIDRDELYTQICKKVNNPAIRSWLGSILAESLVAEVAPVKHGKWTEDGYEGKENVCSQCGSEIPLQSEGGRIPKKQVKFCYFCGAKMDLEG